MSSERTRSYDLELAVNCGHELVKRSSMVCIGLRSSPIQQRESVRLRVALDERDRILEDLVA